MKRQAAWLLVHLRVARFLWKIVLCTLATGIGARAGSLPYKADPDIVRQLDVLESNSAVLLPPVRVDAGGLTMHGMDRRGPGQRDYCNKMVYAPERQTALYAGGNHQVPHRMNDVWEYHLGSNAWHLLYAPDGGNAGKHKAAYFLTSRTLVREPDKKLTDDEKAAIESYRAWWTEHVVFEGGHVATRRGGPIMPSHTWDAFSYDARARRLIWGMGASAAAQLTTHARFSGNPLDKLEQRVDLAYTPMWMFDPERRCWEHHRAQPPRPTLRGMGATMAYLPDQGQSIWYVAAQNVSPHAYEMWLFDGVANAWHDLKPNSGVPIRDLAFGKGVAPTSEQQSAYSPRHRKLVAVKGHDTFVYDVGGNTWSKALTDKRIYGHDAYSIFAYDTHADVFLLLFPPEGKRTALKLAAYDLKQNEWTFVDVKGPPFPPPKYGRYMGYYDPTYNVFVAQPRYCDRMWVYRHRK